MRGADKRCLPVRPCCVLTLRSSTPPRQLGLLMNRLQKIADEFNVAVVITNQVRRLCMPAPLLCTHADAARGAATQVMADPGGMTFAGADNKKARRLLSTYGEAPCGCLTDAPPAFACAAHWRPRAGTRVDDAPVPEEGRVLPCCGSGCGSTGDMR